MIVAEENVPVYGEDDLIIPITVRTAEGKEPVIEAYPEFLDVAEHIAGLPREKMLDRESVREIIEMSSRRVSELGYEIDPDDSAVNLIYRIDDRKKVNLDLVLPSGEALLPGHEYVNLTDCEVDPLGLGYLCFGTVLDGKIVSIATENPHGEDESEIDIGVETAHDFRGKGYGKSNVASLCYYLLDPGVGVTYIVRRDNEASSRLAESVGFELCGEEFCLVCRKKSIRI